MVATATRLLIRLRRIVGSNPTSGANASRMTASNPPPRPAAFAYLRGSDPRPAIAPATAPKAYPITTLAISDMLVRPSRVKESRIDAAIAPATAPAMLIFQNGSGGGGGPPGPPGRPR